MRYAVHLAALFLAITAMDKLVNDSRMARSLDRSIVDYSHKPADIADQAVSFLTVR